MLLEPTIFVGLDPYEPINSSVARSPAKLLHFWLIVKWNPDGTHDIGGFKSHRPHHFMS